MPENSRVVVIGAAAGGPDALRRLLSHLPAGFPAPVLVAMHVGSYRSTSRATPKYCAGSSPGDGFPRPARSNF